MDRNGESEERKDSTEPGKSSQSSKASRAWRSLSYASVGIEMAVATIIGWGFGRYLDTKFGTDPILMLVFLLLGTAAGFKGLIRAGNQARRESNEP